MCDVTVWNPFKYVKSFKQGEKWHPDLGRNEA
jgi:hypothetical protein